MSLDFVRICEQRTSVKGGEKIEIFPRFLIKKSEDLMIRGGDFYAFWNEETGMWSTDEFELIKIIDDMIQQYMKKHNIKLGDEGVCAKFLFNAQSGSVDQWHKYCQRQMRDCYQTLDQELIFENTEVKKDSYASKRLPYALKEGNFDNFDKLIGTLYVPKERAKIEWCIGAIVTGASKELQKFMVLYGTQGAGKSTIMNIMQMLFDGYYAPFKSKDLGSSNSQFALEPFKENPLVGIEHDGNLSRIEDNTRINSLVSHELMTINEKNKSIYASRFGTFLVMGSNSPVHITNAKSGLIRRLIDVSPSMRKLPRQEYDQIMENIKFELGAIAWHCKEVFEKDPHKYDDYRPLAMMSATNDFFNFMLDNYPIFAETDGVTLANAWKMYKDYAEETKIPYTVSQRNFREELKNYFEEVLDRHTLEDGTRVRSYYHGFRKRLFDDTKEKEEPADEPITSWLTFNKTVSLLDDILKDCPAQYPREDGSGKLNRTWANCTTCLKDILTSKVHYVKPPVKLIVIDFDLKDEDGNKSLAKNLEAASKWPSTYAELSKSGQGIHLHYWYQGDVEKLSRIFDDEIEIKVWTGGSSLRRMVSRCNDVPIRTISSGLPLKEEKVVNTKTLEDEKHLRVMLKKCLDKEIHSNTTQSVAFICELLNEAYQSGMNYDVSDLESIIYRFAGNSTNQSAKCLAMLEDVHFKSVDDYESFEDIPFPEEAPIAFFDVEVFPNLFVVCWKLAGKPVERMINPSQKMIEDLCRYKLVGFNNRKYDNHILYARLLGYSNIALYNLSQSIINAGRGERASFFAEAYNLSYTDIYDFSANKQSLKKWEIELGIHHQELPIPWDEEVPETRWNEVADYCCNDVEATEALWNHLQGDWKAREMLVDIATTLGQKATANDTTNTLSAKIIFGSEKYPDLVYTDLKSGMSYPSKGNMDYVTFEQWQAHVARAREGVDISKPRVNDKGVIVSFPEYEFVKKPPKMKKLKAGEVAPAEDKEEEETRKWPYENLFIFEQDGEEIRQNVGKGGYIVGHPGIYSDVAMFDVTSLHPTSAILMNAFGKYTGRYEDIYKMRVAIKNHDLETARGLMGGLLAQYLDDESQADDLAQALKIVLNSTYGVSAASFCTKFRAADNLNNIIALRGALFMKKLELACEERGWDVVGIRTDSIKIANVKPEMVDFIMEFGKKYGYSFDLECLYDRIALVNKSAYIAKYASEERSKDILGFVPKDNHKHPSQWTATAKQFQVPYVFKSLFSKEHIEFKDLCETKSVKTALYLDRNEAMDDPDELAKELKTLERLEKRGKATEADISRAEYLRQHIPECHDYQFVGKVGLFCPIKEGFNGGHLVMTKKGKTGYDSATGAKGYRWLEAEEVSQYGEKGMEMIDRDYFRTLTDDAVAAISKFGDFEAFTAD